MNALFITARWPDPLAEFNHGTAMRMRVMMRAILAAGFSLDVLVYAPAEQPLGDSLTETIRRDFQRHWGVAVTRLWLVNEARVSDRADQLWQGYIRPMFGVGRQPGYARVGAPAQREALARVLAESRPGFVFAHRLVTMWPLLQLRQKIPPVLLDLDDIEHKTFRRLLETPPIWGAKRLMRAWLPALERWERRAIRASAASFVCSGPDQQYLRQRFSAANVQVVPNSAAVPVASAIPAEKSLLFLGLLSYAPNREGAEFLIQQIWPEILRQHPDAVLRIAGKGAEGISGFGAPQPGVEFLGYVDDLGDLYRRSQVVVCPLLSGGGTRIKIIEAALHGRPVVSTTIGAEGLSFSADAGEIVIADRPSAFAQAVGTLFDDPQRGRAVGAAARAAALAHYSEDMVVGRVVAEIHRLAVHQGASA